MSVEQTTKIIASDGETVLGEFAMQDGGLAAEVDIPKDWFTPANLRDLAAAALRMASTIENGGA